MTVTVLYEDNHLLAIDKPAGLITMGAPAGRANLLAIAKDYIREKHAKPGNVYLGVVSRLDTPVTGVIVFARTSKAAARLAEQFRSGAVVKEYLALVSGGVRPPEGRLVDWLRKHERHRKVEAVEPDRDGAQEARLTYRALVQRDRRTLLEIRLETGRKHQIRVQLGRRGHPVVGDYKYGSREEFPSGIALHARRLVVSHPVSREPLEIVAPLPLSWARAGWGESASV